VSAELMREVIEQFFGDFVVAQRDRDVAFLLDRLHPAVVERYADTACEATSPGSRQPTRQSKC
jgi:hypothetical protein